MAQTVHPLDAAQEEVRLSADEISMVRSGLWKMMEAYKPAIDEAARARDRQAVFNLQERLGFASRLYDRLEAIQDRLNRLDRAGA